MKKTYWVFTFMYDPSKPENHLEMIEFAVSETKHFPFLNAFEGMKSLYAKLTLKDFLKNTSNILQVSEVDFQKMLKEEKRTTITN